MNILKRMSIELKIILSTIFMIIMTIIFINAKNTVRAKKTLKYELEKLNKEKDLLLLSEKTVENDKKVEALKVEAANIEEKIKFIEEKEIKGEDLSDDELEDFFTKRGF